MVDLEVASPSVRDTLRTSEGPVLIDVWHPRCSACRALEERWKQVEQRVRDRLTIERINVLKHPAIAEALDIERVPALLVFRRGVLKTRFHGAETIQHFADRIEEEV